MTKYQIMKNYVDWVLPQLQVFKCPYFIEYSWGRTPIIRIIPDCFDIFHDLRNDMISFFPEEWEEIKIIIKHRINSDGTIRYS